MTKHTVEVFTTSTCPYCVKAKEWLKEKGVAYKEYNVAEDDAKREEMIDKSGQMGVPVIVIDDETVIVGFDTEAMAEALGVDE